MSHPEPLALLREFTCKKEPVVLHDSNGQQVESITDATTILLGTHSFPRAAASGIQSSGSDEYPLDALIFLLHNAHLKLGDYITKCREHNIQQVSGVQKAKILDYLEGKEDSLPREMLVARPAEKRAADDTTGDPNKKAKRTGVNTREMVKRIMERELPAVRPAFVFHGKKDYKDLIEVAKKMIQSPGKPTAALESKSHSKAPKLSSKDRIPIIIVPPGHTALLRLFNIKKFLVDQKYVDAQELGSQGSKPEKVTIERKKDGKTVLYQVVDDVKHFKPNDWDRVCCVFVTGDTWQFKKWKWTEPADIFNKVLGFYPIFKGDKRKKAAVSWAVKDIEIDRAKTYNIPVEVKRFWKELDRFNEKHKRDLIY